MKTLIGWPCSFCGAVTLEHRGTRAPCCPECLRCTWCPPRKVFQLTGAHFQQLKKDMEEGVQQEKVESQETANE